MANRAGLGEKIGPLAGIETQLARLAGRQQLLPATLEHAMQQGHETQRLGRKDAVPLRAQCAAKVDAFKVCGGHCLAPA